MAVSGEVGDKNSSIGITGLFPRISDVFLHEQKMQFFSNTCAGYRSCGQQWNGAEGKIEIVGNESVFSPP